MVIRRSLYLALRWAPVVLPIWFILIAGIRGWREIGVLGVPLMGLGIAVALAVVFGLTWLRKDVRRAGAVSWVDVGVLAVWFALIIASPFPIDAPVTVFVAVVGLVAFWSAAIQWFLETRRRVKAVMDDFGVAVTSAQEYQATRVTNARSATPDAPLRGQVIRIDPPAPKSDD